MKPTSGKISLWHDFDDVSAGVIHGASPKIIFLELANKLFSLKPS